MLLAQRHVNNVETVQGLNQLGICGTVATTHTKKYAQKKCTHTHTRARSHHTRLSQNLNKKLARQCNVHVAAGGQDSEQQTGETQDSECSRREFADAELALGARAPREHTAILCEQAQMAAAHHRLRGQGETGINGQTGWRSALVPANTAGSHECAQTYRTFTAENSMATSLSGPDRVCHHTRQTTPDTTDTM